MSELDDIRRRLTALEETVVGEAALRAAAGHLRKAKQQLARIDGKLDEVLRLLGRHDEP